METLPDSAGNVILGWFDKTKGKAAVYLAKTIISPDSSRVERKQIINQTIDENKVIIQYAQENVIFADNFEKGISELWQQISGYWVWKDRMYIGYGGAKSFLNIEPLSDFVFSGKFKLDPINHHDAGIFFRINDKNLEQLSYYRVINFFRVGITLEYFDGNTPSQIIDVPYPFQKDTWYSFRVVMKGNALNYFINDSLLVSKNFLVKNPDGKLGVGCGAPPTYFKNISITTIKNNLDKSPNIFQWQREISL